MTVEKIFIYGFLILGSMQVFADASASCKPNGYQELLRCMTEGSADIRISEQQLKAANQLDGIARQWINPDLSADNVQRSGNKSETTASLLFNIRLGGKRSALINEARGEINKATASRDLNTAQAKLSIILRLYEISHLNGEIKIEEESVKTYSKIVGMLQRRPALTPEEQVSLSVFKMAYADNKLNVTKLKTNQERIIRELNALTGVPSEVIVANLPPPRNSWPDFKSEAQVESSPHMRFAAAELQVARSQKEKAIANSWPDLKIGPAVRIVNDGVTNDSFYGAAISIPLPVFNLNGAGRAYGQERLVEAQMSYDLAQRKVTALRDQLVKKYLETTTALKESLSNQVIEDRHEQTEKLFFKGVVPSALVIEAHRQLIQLEQKKNESTREAIEALGSIYIIDNKFSEVLL